MKPRIYKAAKKGYAYFQFKYDPVLVQVARGIPNHRKWNPEHKVWEFKLSEPSVRHIQRYCPEVLVDAEIENYLREIEEKRAQARLQQSQTQGVSAEDIRDYKFKTTPFAHQAEAFLRSRNLESFALFMEQGTGKTKVIIDSAAYLFAQGKIDALVVAAPNSVKTNWVYDELETHLPDWVDYHAAYWEAKAKKAEAKSLDDLCEPNGKFKILVVNIEGLSTKRAADFAVDFCAKRRCMVVVDESSRIKTPSAKRTRTCNRMAKHALYKRILSGTPVTQGPMDLYAQMSFLDEDILGFTSFYAFRNRYAIMGGFEDKQIIGYQNLDELQDKIEPYSFRVLKQDCLDLPEKIYQRIEVEHTPEQKRAYANMKKRMQTDLADGTISTAKIALTALGKLQQINSNHTKNDDDETVIVDPNKNPRLDTLVELLEQHGGKAIIWSRYRYDIEAITARLNHEFGKGCAAAFYGGVDSNERMKIRQEFQREESELQFFVGNAAAGGIGLTLTQASLVVYYSNDFSLESRLQSEDRAHRIGQVRNVTYVDMVVPGTIDEKILKALRDKRDIASLVTKDNIGEWI